MKFETTEMRISGAICGTLWSGVRSGRIFSENILIYRRKTKRGLCATLDTILSELGGDFETKKFADGTQLKIVRKSVTARGMYTVHTKTLDLSTVVPDKFDLRHEVGDFLRDCEND